MNLDSALFQTNTEVFLMCQHKQCVFILKQVPQWCAEFCLSVRFHHGMVVCSQIHAQQAVDLALRAADEMDVNIGHEVGYSIPLETCCSNETVLRYLKFKFNFFTFKLRYSPCFPLGVFLFC